MWENNVNDVCDIDPAQDVVGVEQNEGLCNTEEMEHSSDACDVSQGTSSFHNVNKRKIDNLGRVRPKKYVKENRKSKVVLDLQENAENEMHTTDDHLQTTEIGDQSNIKTQEHTKAIFEVAGDMIENTVKSSDIDEDDPYDNLISDEKWRELFQENENNEDLFENNETEKEESNLSFDTNRGGFDNAPIYPGHTMTIHSSMVLILLYTMSHSISGSQLADLLTLIGVHCLQSHPGLQSVHMFKRYFANMQTPIQKHFYCKYCMSGVREEDVNCPSENCGRNISGVTSKSYFIEIPLERQIEKIMKRPGILNSIHSRFTREKKRNDGIEDIYDGNIYKKLSSSGGPLSEDYPNNISLTWNTDGIPVFKSSKFSLWPLYLVINELPYKERMLKENMILCSLWFGETKPFISLFTKPLMKSLKNLETNGIQYDVAGTEIKTKAFLICGTADLPAKSLVMNVNQFNGQFSCMKCLHPGETYKTQLGGCVHVFPYDASKPKFDERTIDGCVKDAFAAIESKKTTNGIKGPSLLMTLRTYDFVKSTSIDYMHGVLLGIGKLLTKLWISSTYSKEKFSISSYVDVIDERLKCIKPPSSITRVPRSLSDHFKYWKASELRSWMFFYSLPILSDILSEEYFTHYACLVQGIYLLSLESIMAADIQKSSELLSYFVHMFPSLYGERYVTLNMHSLLHLPQCVEDLGPLWVYSCFPFENINGIIMELFHGTQNVELQIVYSINVVQNMSEMMKDLNNEKLTEFACSMTHKHALLKVKTGSSLSIPIGASTKVVLTDHMFEKLVTECKYVPSKMLSYKRISLRGMTLHSTNYTRVQVRNTFTVKFYDSLKKLTRYGFVSYYILAKKCVCVNDLCSCSSALMAVICELECSATRLVKPIFLFVDAPHIKVVNRSENIHIVDVTKILNVVVFIDGFGIDGKSYVCDFPNMKESD